MCNDIKSLLEWKIPNIKVDIRQERKKNAWRVSISSSREHILSVVRELDRHGFGIQIADKFDKAVFYQRRWRRSAAIKATRYCPKANVFEEILNSRVNSLTLQGMLLKDIAETLHTDRNTLRRYCQGRSFPSHTAVFSRFCGLLGVEEKDLIDWSHLESLNLIPPAWELKDNSYHYHGLRIGVFGEIIQLKQKSG